MATNSLRVEMEKLNIRLTLQLLNPALTENELTALTADIQQRKQAQANCRRRGRALRLIGWGIGTLGVVPVVHFLERRIDPDHISTLDMFYGD